MDEGRAEQAALVERAKREIALAKEAAIKDLYAAAASLVTQASAKVVGRELASQDHQRLIADSIAQVAARLGRKSSIVDSRPCSGATFGSQPSSARARVISG